MRWAKDFIHWATHWNGHACKAGYDSEGIKGMDEVGSRGNGRCGCGAARGISAVDFHLLTGCPYRMPEVVPNREQMEAMQSEATGHRHPSGGWIRHSEDCQMPGVSRVLREEDGET